MHRFFVAGAHDAGATIAFAPDDARKIALVLRLASGDVVEVIDSTGAAFAARLRVEGRVVGAVLEERRSRDVEPAVRIVLAQAIPKGQKMDYVVEKATELGVAAIVPLRTARVAGEHTGDAKRERWARIARAAAQQSGRTVVPAIEPEADWAAFCAGIAGYDRVYVPWELAEPVPLRERFEGETAASVALAIGPEGGFSADEVAAAVEAGAVTISLGKRILRTETAGLVAVAALLYARGQL